MNSHGTLSGILFYFYLVEIVVWEGSMLCHARSFFLIKCTAVNILKLDCLLWRNKSHNRLFLSCHNSRSTWFCFSFDTCTFTFRETLDIFIWNL